jgi:hypothetical protein
MRSEEQDGKTHNGDSALAAIVALIERDHGWDSGQTLRRLRSILDQLVSDAPPEMLDTAFSKLVVYVGDPRYANKVPQAAIMQLFPSLSKALKTKLAEALLDETIISIDCAEIMSEFMIVPLDRLDLILDFLCDFASLLGDEELSAVQTPLRRLSQVLPDLLLEKGNVESIAAVVRIAAHIEEEGVSYILSALKERFEQASLATRRCISQGIREALPTSIGCYHTQSVRVLHKWGTDLQESQSSTSDLLGQTLVTLSLTILEGRD